MLVTLNHSFVRLSNALAWRVRRMVGDALIDRTIVELARCWRPVLRKPVFIGIIGSAGKTTTKELLLSVLALKGRGTTNPDSLNALPEVAKTLLRTRPTHDFCVAELSEDKPGILDVPLALLLPHIGIVTIVGDDHSSADYARDAIAREMSKLITSLPPAGVAVLNADDELVLAMAEHCRARVITYGVSTQADLRAEDISSNWPDRLRMTVVQGGERVTLRTQLCGTHWVPAVLGAIGGGLATGMTLSECAEGIASVVPVAGRMQPVTTSDGVTFIRDDFKAPMWSLDTCFEFMKTAQAKRKIVVIGELNDIGSQKGRKYAKIALLAQNIADITIFIGPWASSVLRSRKPGTGDGLCVFSHSRDAAAYINLITREGDLVLLKGTNKQDHLLRIILARSENIACWRDDCGRSVFCNECPHRATPSGAPALRPLITINETAAPNPPHGAPAVEWDEWTIVGLGNPEARYANTPHNVGYRVVERLAASWGLTWDTTSDAWIARGSIQGTRVCLVKIRMAMNLIGIGLKQLSKEIAANPEQCILVFDDFDLPLGVVKTRLNGGAGGHRGVASILEAFQTDNFRRVKIGIGKEDAKINRVDYVLSAFDEASRDVVNAAILTAEARLLEMTVAQRKFPSKAE